MHDMIRQAIYRTCAAIDRGQYDWLDDIFAPEAVIVAGPYEGPLKDFVAQLDARRASTPQASHLIGNILITPLSDSRAFAESYCYVVEQSAHGSDAPAHRAVSLRYADLFAEQQGRWRIVRRTTIVDVVHPPQPLPENSSYRGPQGRRDATDPALLMLAEAEGAPA